MDNSLEKLEQLFSHFKEYLTNHVKIIKIEIAEKIATIVSTLISLFWVSIFVVLFVIFLGVSLALFLGELTGSYYIGFLIVSGFYLLLAIILWKGKNRFIKIPVMNFLLRQLFKAD